MMKKILCLALTLALICCGAVALAEDDVQTKLDAANARIAELEAEVAKYRPYYEAQIVAEYDGGVIFRADALEQYAYIESMYANYGVSLADYGLESQYQQMAVQQLVQDAALAAKAADLGLDQLDEQTLADLTEQAASSFESYITSVSSYFTGEGVTEEETRAQAIEYLNSLGYTQEALLEDLKVNYVGELLYNYATADVALTDEDVQTSYDALVAEQEATFANDPAYNNSRNSGEIIVWNPEGYRAVKHVLVKFTDEQAALYDELNDELTNLADELAALENPSEEAAEEAAEETESTEEPRTIEQIREEQNSAMADLDALYAELMPTAQEVIDKFNDGADFADLIAEYNEDPGMQNEPTATNGYAVCATSTTWDPAFTEGAMSIADVGGISGPICGQNGIHVIYYASDIPAGPVALEDVRTSLESTFLDEKLSTTYNTALEDWVSAINPVYHYENLTN